jgi:membrane protein YdbS with pleckstrin-like domain
MALDEDATGTSMRWHAPSPRLTVLRRYEVGAITLVSLIVAVVLTLVLDAAGVAIAAAVAVLLAGACADTVAERRVRAWRYAERAEDLIVKRGVMFRRTSVIPYGRMQYVEVTAGPFERAFGLATVQMHTAAAASDARIPGLPAEEAARLRDQLTSLGESHAMGL